MASLEEIRNGRIEKMNLLEKEGINPYPARIKQTHTLLQLRTHFEELENKEEEVSVVGRIMSVRGQGALVFVDLFDGTGKIQLLCKADQHILYKDKNIDDAFSLFKEAIDIGDFIEVSGTVFVSKRGEETVLVKQWGMVAKSLRPIPDEWYGLKDEDERYRKRYLDILLNKDVQDRIKRRSVFWNTIRTFLLEKGYTEVETPVLENTPGGADARPFITHHNALDIDVYLRISGGELWQKKLLVAGMPKVFEIGRIFRNEGMSHEHLQDYTQLEFYEAFSDYTKGMDMVVELYREIAQKTFGTTVFTINDQEVDLAKEWQTYDYVKIIEEKSGVNVLEADVSTLTKKLKELQIDFDPKDINKERATDLIWKKCRKELTGPGFLVNVPVFMEPLAKKSEEDSRVVERFQIILGGSEMGKGFSELNDPRDQRERFEHQEALRAAGDDEAQMKDDEYVEAMEYGMPPAFGFGTSERLFAVLEGVSVREGQIFPMMRPKE